MKTIQPLHLIIGGCALAIIGSCLPWASFTVMGETHTTSGLDGDGVITLILAIGALVLGFVKMPGKEKVMALIGAILAGLAAIIGLYDLMNIKDKTSDVSVLGGALGDAFKFSIGIGLYLVIIGGAVGALGAVMRMGKAGPAAANPPPPLN